MPIIVVDDMAFASNNVRLVIISKLKLESTF